MPMRGGSKPCALNINKIDTIMTLPPLPQDSDTTEKIDTAPPCGIFVRLDQAQSGPDFMRRLREIFFIINHADSAYTKNSHVVCCDPDMAKSLGRDQLKNCIEISKAQGIVFLFEDDVDLALDLEADGVLLDTARKDDIKTVREKIGTDPIVGLRCGIDIDLAEEAIAKGADFVSFHTGNKTMVDPKLAAVWSTLSELPCLMEGPITNDYLRADPEVGGEQVVRR